MNETGYIELVKKVLNHGEHRQTRNAYVRSLFGEHLEFNISPSKLPIFTTKKISFKNVFEELMFFLKGETDSKILESKGVNIWKNNTSKTFLESRNLDYREGDMGPMYGFQWNHFGAEYKGCDVDYKNQGINQIDNCIDLIKNDPTNRRIMFTALDPSNLSKMVLAPCHTMFQFYVRTDRNGVKFLDGQLYQRSADLMLGVPYNVLSYSLLILMISRYCEIQPGNLKICFGDVHIYDEHLSGALEQIRRIPNDCMYENIRIHNKASTPIREYKLKDIEICFYNPQPNIKMKMIP